MLLDMLRTIVHCLRLVVYSALGAIIGWNVGVAVIRLVVRSSGTAETNQFALPASPLSFPGVLCLLSVCVILSLLLANKVNNLPGNSFIKKNRSLEVLASISVFLFGSLLTVAYFSSTFCFDSPAVIPGARCPTHWENHYDQTGCVIGYICVGHPEIST
jgi:hypothetical protein